MKKVKIIIILAVTIVAVLALYRALFIRIVNYEVANVKIPSEYNILTGRIKPIENYKGRTDLPSVSLDATKSLGLSNTEIMVAHLRWAVFEEWLKKHPEYKGWESDPEKFKKANDAFRKDFESHTKVVSVK